jgi:hypothetical protein
MRDSVLLTDDNEVLYRQIHPDLMDGDVPASSNFVPKRSDNNELSLDRSSITSADAAFTLYTGAGYLSVAVYGVAVGEFRAEKISCREDPIALTPSTWANPAHAVADYSAHSPNQQKTIGKRIKQKAIARGKLHPRAPT